MKAVGAQSTNSINSLPKGEAHTSSHLIEKIEPAACWPLKYVIDNQSELIRCFYNIPFNSHGIDEKL